MNKNIVVLSVGAALLLSTFWFDVSHAVHIDRTKQYANTQTTGIMNAPATATAPQVAKAPIPCRGDGMRRTGAPCTTPSLPAGMTNETLYTIVVASASVIFTLAVVLLSVSFSRRTPQAPLVKNIH